MYIFLVGGCIPFYFGDMQLHLFRFVSIYISQIKTCYLIFKHWNLSIYLSICVYFWIGPIFMSIFLRLQPCSHEGVCYRVIFTGLVSPIAVIDPHLIFDKWDLVPNRTKYLLFSYIWLNVTSYSYANRYLSMLMFSCHCVRFHKILSKQKPEESDK